MNPDTLTVEFDRTVTIKSLHQWRTYATLMEGLPTAHLNARILSYAGKYALKYCGLEEFYVVEPEQLPIQLPIEYKGNYPFGDPATLPDVTCLAEVWYPNAVRDQNKDFSSLAIIWFQDAYAFPIDAAVVDKIRHIPFSAVAGDFDY